MFESEENSRVDEDAKTVGGSSSDVSTSNKVVGNNLKSKPRNNVNKISKKGKGPEDLNMNSNVDKKGSTNSQKESQGKKKKGTKSSMNPSHDKDELKGIPHQPKQEEIQVQKKIKGAKSSINLSHDKDELKEIPNQSKDEESRGKKKNKGTLSSMNPSLVKDELKEIHIHSKDEESQGKKNKEAKSSINPSHDKDELKEIHIQSKDEESRGKKKKGAKSSINPSHDKDELKEIHIQSKDEESRGKKKKGAKSSMNPSHDKDELKEIPSQSKDEESRGKKKNKGAKSSMNPSLVKDELKEIHIQSKDEESRGKKNKRTKSSINPSHDKDELKEIPNQFKDENSRGKKKNKEAKSSMNPSHGKGEVKVIPSQSKAGARRSERKAEKQEMNVKMLAGDSDIVEVEECPKGLDVPDKTELKSKSKLKSEKVSSGTNYMTKKIGTLTLKSFNNNAATESILNALTDVLFRQTAENFDFEQRNPRYSENQVSVDLFTHKNNDIPEEFKKVMQEHVAGPSSSRTESRLLFEWYEKDSVRKKRDAEREISVIMSKIFTEKSFVELESTEEPKKEKKKRKKVDLSNLDTLIHEIKIKDETKKKKEQAYQAAEEFEQTCKMFMDKIRNLDEDDPAFNKNLSTLKHSFGLEMGTYRQGMPIYAFKSKIIETVENHDVTVLVAETGSGKSTQLVKYLLNEDKPGLIACTQPRKIAATSLASFVSKSLGSAVGEIVGYDFGFQKKSSKGARIVFKTDHSLITEWAEDPPLSKYHCIIVDEAHERSLSTDMLLSIVKNSLTDPRRNFPLKVVITSATIDPSLFLNFFSKFKTKLLEIPGKIHPIEVFWGDEPLNVSGNYVKKAVDKVEDILRSQPNDSGAILVFLATPMETEKGQQQLQARVDVGKVEVLQFHGKLPLEEQEKVFSSSRNKRRVVFATNVAETSITVPDVTVVVDAGVVKEREYDPLRNVGTLKLVPINRSSARQRMGRAGRTKPGKCYRLYTKHEHDTLFKENMVPEIKRVPLDQCLLQLISLGVADPRRFEFMEPPAMVAIEKSIQTLAFLAAIEHQEESNLTLTELGKKMSLFAFDPRISKLLVSTSEKNCQYLFEAVVLSAMVASGGNVFFRMGTEEEKEAADVQKLQFCEENSDFITMLRVYFKWASAGNERQKSGFCRENFINGKSMKAILGLKKEIEALLAHNFGKRVEKKTELSASAEKYLMDEVTKCFSRHIAIYTGHPQHGYLTLFDQELLQLHPSSSLFHMSGNWPKFLVFDQMLITSRCYMMHVNSINEGDEHVDSFHHLITSEKVENYILSSHIIKPIGSLLMRKYLIGKGFSEMKATQEEISTYMTLSDVTKFIKIECDVDMGSISIFCHSKYIPVAVALLQSKIESAVKGFREEIRTLKMPNNQFSLLIASGGTVKEPLLPFDFVTVCIKQPFDGAQVEEVVKAYLDCPKIRFLTDGRCLIMFETPSQANSGLLKLKWTSTLLELMGIEAHQVFAMQRRKEQFESHPNLLLTLEFVRRCRKNFGFVEFEDEIKAANFKMNAQTGLPIKGCRGDLKTVRLVPLDDHYTHEELRKLIPEDVYGKVTIKLPLEPPFESSGEDIEKLIHALDELINGRFRVPKQLYTIGPVRNEKQFATWRFNVEFSSIEAGCKLASDWKYYIQRLERFSFKSVNYTINTRIVTYTEVYNNAKEAIEKSLAEHPDVKMTSNVKKDRIILNFNTDNNLALSQLKIQLKHCLEEETFTHENLKYFEVPENWAKLRKMCDKECKVIMKKCTRGEKVSITMFGTEGNKTKALYYINSLLSTIIQNNTSFETFQLSGPNVKRGILKLILKQYGVDLNKLRSKPGILEAKLNFMKHRSLTVEGSLEAVQEVKEEFKNMVDALDGDQDSEEELCSTCFTSPEKADRYRLETCGHLICSSTCLKLLITSCQLPLTCPTEGCQSKICVQDLSFIFDQDEEDSLRRKFMKNVLDFFMSTCDGKFIFCPTPDCGGIAPRYDPNAIGSKIVYRCVDCQCDICIRCGKAFHAGFNCEIAEVLINENLKEWMVEDPKNRRLCPTCHMGIEKNGGCDHVHCGQCNSHICWKCMTVENNGIYEHMAVCRGKL